MRLSGSTPFEEHADDDQHDHQAAHDAEPRARLLEPVRGAGVGQVNLYVLDEVVHGELRDLLCETLEEDARTDRHGWSYQGSSR